MVPSRSASKCRFNWLISVDLGLLMASFLLPGSERLRIQVFPLSLYQPPMEEGMPLLCLFFTLVEGGPIPVPLRSAHNVAGEVAELLTRHNLGRFQARWHSMSRLPMKSSIRAETLETIFFVTIMKSKCCEKLQLSMDLLNKRVITNLRYQESFASILSRTSFDKTYKRHSIGVCILFPCLWYASLN